MKLAVLSLGFSTAIGALLLSSGRAHADNIYVSDANWGYGGASITEFGPSGQGTVFADADAYNPQGLAFDSSGNLYVASVSGNSEILEIDAAGDVSVFASGLSDPQYIAAQVPEPSAWAILALGAGAFHGSGRLHHRARRAPLN